jgi:pimeloyl-ACP methyl ester carboxylesterase
LSNFGFLAKCVGKKGKLGEALYRKVKLRKWKRWVLGVGVAAAVGFALLNALAYRHAYLMLHFQGSKAKTEKPENLSVGQKIKVLLWGVSLPRPDGKLPVSGFDSSARSLQIPGTNGIKLGAWYAPGATNGTLVILFHGYTADKTSMVAEAKAFLDLGSSTLLVDFRGSGDSSESYTTIGYVEAEDVEAAVEFARREFSPRKIVLYGDSMGAAAVLRAVGDCEVKPDAIVIEGVFDTLLHTVRHRFEAMHTPSFPSAELLVFWGGEQSGFNGFRHNPIEYAKGVTCPALFLHGSADSRAHVEEARSVYDAVPGPKEFKEFPNVGHAATVTRYPEEWRQTVSEFLRTNGIAVR